MSEEIRNKVAESGIITIDPESFIPQGERVMFDMKPLLFMEQILKEKELRDFIKQNDWKKYQGKLVALTCTNDAIIPTWAYMLVSMAMEPYASKIVFGDLQKLEETLIEEAVNELEVDKYKGARIVIKGCGERAVPVNIYVKLSSLLKPVAKSIMYGEPCSTVPLFKAN